MPRNLRTRAPRRRATADKPLAPEAEFYLLNGFARYRAFPGDGTLEDFREAWEMHGERLTKNWYKHNRHAPFAERLLALVPTREREIRAAFKATDTRNRVDYLQVIVGDSPRPPNWWMLLERLERGQNPPYDDYLSWPPDPEYERAAAERRAFWMKRLESSRRTDGP